MKKKISLRQGFRIIFKYLLVYKKEIIFLSVLGLVIAATDGVVPYIAGRLIDSIIKPREVSLFSFVFPGAFAYLSIWAVLRLFGSFASWKQDLRSRELSLHVEADFRSNAFGRLLVLPISFHKKYKMGTILERFNRAANSLERIINAVIINIAPQFLGIIVAFVLGIIVSPIFALILAVGAIVFVIILFRAVQPLSELYRRGHKLYSEAYGDACDAVQNVREIKQATAEKYEQRKIFTNFKRKAIPAWLKLESIWSSLSFYQQITILLTTFLIYFIGILFIAEGKLTVGQLIMFNAYAAMFFGPFVQLGFNWQTIHGGLIALVNAEELISEPSEVYEPIDAIRLKTIRGNVEFKNVEFYYKRNQPILQNISFKAVAGEIIALVGESGVGKSTLVDLISAYHFPKLGRIFVDENDIKKINLSALRKHIAVVSQEVVLFNDTILKNIKYGSFDAGQRQIEEAARKAHALEFIEKFPKKWSQVVGERGIKLSVGQKQRVAIARAILRNPRILILDEPTSALDARSESIIQESLRELMAGRTTFVIAHRLSTVRNADKIIVLDGGRIVEQGRHAELVQIPDGRYRKLYELQIGLHE